jgi:uncharacterized protein (TIGR04255 family)
MVSRPKSGSAGKNVLPRPGAQARPADLPDFDNPPLVEVVLSVQFAELTKYRSLHTGLLWEKFRNAGFTEFSEHGALEQRFETFGPQESPQVGLRVIPSETIPPPRVWFIKKGGNELVQIQADRFVRNWRKIADHGEYPRYEYMRDKFFDELKIVEKFFAAEGIGRVQPNQCEVTYVNLIRFHGDVWGSPDRVVRLLSAANFLRTPTEYQLPKFESAHYAARFVLIDERGEPYGRVIVALQPALAPGGERMLRLELTARGAPLTPELEGVIRFFDVGRVALANVFTAITTDEMHRDWQRKQ